MTRSRLAWGLAYLTVMTLWIYGVLDQTGTDSAAWLLPVIASAQIGVGFVVGRWWAVVLPVLVVLISVPARDPPITPDNVEPFPLFFSLGIGAIFAVPLVAAGLTLRWIYDRRARSRSARLTT